MRKWCILVACLGALLAACNKTPVEVVKHPYTEQERVKAHLDSCFAEFVTALDLDSTMVKHPERFLLLNSRIETDWLDRGIVLYQLSRHGRTVLRIQYRVQTGELWALLYGGIAIRGTMLPMDLHVYDNGTDVAKLEYDLRLPALVFRFPDGTTYALSSLLISEALVDFLIEHVLSTE